MFFNEVGPRLGQSEANSFMGSEVHAVFAGITKTLPFSVTSIDSKLYGLRLSTAKLQFPNSPRCGLAVTCRYGGGGGGVYRFLGDSRRGRLKEAEVDEALDIASIRSATVRLIDGQQNMVKLTPFLFINYSFDSDKTDQWKLQFFCVWSLSLG